MTKIGNKNNNNTSVPTLAEYITAQIASKRAAALDKSRNRTSIRVPMISNYESEEQWKQRLNTSIQSKEELLSRLMASDYEDDDYTKAKQRELDALLEELDKGYPKLIAGSNCMYNAGDCYGLNIPGNQTFVAKHKELGFQKAPKGSMEPGDLVQDVRNDIPIHAMIYDSKDDENNLLFNYARGYDSTSMEENYVKQGKYPLPIKDFDVYKYVGTPADSTQWINEYKQKYGNGMRCGGRRKAQLGLDIREGGIAIPIAPNMYYMDGRSHDNGGIAIGPNNKNGLEVEGGEIVKVGNKDIKVFSSVPLLQGVSPAQLVMGGANPDKVFKAQEDFKDRNRINDDGTRYQVGGNKTGTFSKEVRKLTDIEKMQLINEGYPVTPLTKSYNTLRALGRFRTTLKKTYNPAQAFNSAVKGFMNDMDKTPTSWDAKYGSKKLRLIKSIYDRVIGNRGENIGITHHETEIKPTMKAGGIYIKPSKRGTFTAAATKHGMGVQEFASKVLANKEDYSPAMVKKANFARNAGRWKKEYGGMIYEINGNVKNGLMSLRPKATAGKEKKINSTTKIGEDGLIYTWSPDGEWYTDGTTYKDSKYYMRERSVQSGNKLSTGEVLKQKPIQTIDGGVLDELTITAPKKGKAVENNKTNVSTVKANVVKSTESTPRKGSTTKAKASTSKNAKISRIMTNSPYGAPKQYRPNLTVEGIRNNVIETTPAKAPLIKIDNTKTVSSSTGGGTQSKDGRWVGQYKATNVGDWIGLGSNVLGSILSYGLTKSAINKMPKPIKPVMAQAAKLKTRYNIEPQLTETRESEQMNRATVRRNTQSSNTSLAREQRLLNEARGTRNTLYGQKENIETQLINQDKLNRQSVMRDNVRTYNEYLNKLTATKMAQNEMRTANVNNLISGLTGSVNNILGTIESRRATNNTLRAIAAANPNVDARLIGGFDYYIDPITKRKYNKNQQYVGTING